MELYWAYSVLDYRAYGYIGNTGKENGNSYVVLR